MRVTSKGTWSALKCHKVDVYLKNEAWVNGLELKIEIDNGWIRQNGRYSVTGEKYVVKQFEPDFRRAIAHVNNS